MMAAQEGNLGCSTQNCTYLYYNHNKIKVIDFDDKDSKVYSKYTFACKEHVSCPCQVSQLKNIMIFNYYSFGKQSSDFFLFPMSDVL